MSPPQEPDSALIRQASGAMGFVASETAAESEEHNRNTAEVGRTVDENRGRVFPCVNCGADLEFSIEQQSLACAYCGSIQQITVPDDKEIVENDLAAMLARIRQWRENGECDGDIIGEHEVRCDGCGGNVAFAGTLTSTTCPYCATPLQRERIHDAQTRIPVDAVLPFQVDKPTASKKLKDWVSQLWFAPNDFKKQGANGKFEGVYFPYFTFDAITYTRYAGQRGDTYLVQVTRGKTQVTETRIRWSPAAGDFNQFFDDVLVLAVATERMNLARGLEPWPLGTAIPFTQQVLAGFFARTYDLELEAGFRHARNRMDDALANEVRQRIGGDQQQVDSIKTHYSGLKFKHFLLPVYLLVYRYRDKPYRVFVNGSTGTVAGERPWSAIKITLAVIAASAVALGLVWVANGGG